MDVGYQEIHKNALELLEKIIEKAGTFEPKKVVAEEKTLDKLLRKLEAYLRNKGEEYKAPARITARIRYIFKIHYWSDISKEKWELLYKGIEKLAEPEKITREILKAYGSQLLDKRLTWHPVTERAEKDIEKVKEGFKRNYGCVPFEEK